MSFITRIAGLFTPKKKIRTFAEMSVTREAAKDIYIKHLKEAAELKRPLKMRGEPWLMFNIEDEEIHIASHSNKGKLITGDRYMIFNPANRLHSAAAEYCHKTDGAMSTILSADWQEKYKDDEEGISKTIDEIKMMRGIIHFIHDGEGSYTLLFERVAFCGETKKLLSDNIKVAVFDDNCNYYGGRRGGAIALLKATVSACKAMHENPELPEESTVLVTFLSRIVSIDKGEKIKTTESEKTDA